MDNFNKIKTKWDLSKLFRNDEDPGILAEQGKIHEEGYKFINKWKDRQDYLENPVILKEALDEYEKWSKYFGTSGLQGYYFGLRSSLDQTNPKLKARTNKLSDFSIKIANDIQFFGIRISKIPEIEQKKFLESPLLKDYKHYLESSFEDARYTLTEPEEKIMNLKQKTSLSNWTHMVSEFISKETVGKKSFEEILSLISNKNKKTRETAAKQLEKIFKKHLDVSEHEINTVCENLKVNSDLRGYTRPDQSRHLHDDIESTVVDSLLNAVTKRFDISIRYYKQKAKLLGIKKLRYFERNVELGEVTKKYSFEDSTNLVYETFKNLDPKFSEIFKNFVENGHFDVFPKKGKSGGAYCACAGNIAPTYILLNHTNKLRDVLTIAHEMGHGINDELMKGVQNEINFGTPTSTAEVASTFMEDFVFQTLLKDAHNDERLVLLMSKLESDISSIFRQVAFYNFELELHKTFKEKGYIPKDEIGKIFEKHMISYMGEAGKGSNNWWIYVGHFRYYFYVYSYASGLLISKSLQSSVKKDPKFIEKVKEFLSAGTSDSPKNIFKKMGVDISDKEFWDKGLNEVEALLNETEAISNNPL